MVRAEPEHEGPLHAHLKRVLRAAIDDHFENGQRFWPENVLIDRLGMSQNTVRRALGDLAQEGILERRVAKGSFVRKIVDPTTTAVGVLVAQHNSETLSACIEELSGVCRGLGYWFQVYPTHRGENVQEVLRHLEAGPMLKRFVLLGNPAPATCELWDALTSRGCRVVCINTPAEGKPANYVGMNDEHSTRMAIEFLQGLGHQRIIYVSNEPSNHPCVIAREQSFQKYATDLNVPEATVISCHTRPWEDSGKAILRVMPQVMEKNPTALITASDVGAWAAMSWMSSHDIRIPQDISVLSFDNSYTSQFTAPPLTTMTQAHPAIARWAVELLDATLDLPQQILLEPELVQRRSTGPAPGLG